MSLRVRTWLFLVFACVLAPVMLLAMRGLPGFGQIQNVYADAINTVCVPERNLTNAVSAVNFDYRGVDTLGEEFILFTAVTGLAVLLRTVPIDDEAVKTPPPGVGGQPPERRNQPAGDAERWLGLILVAACIVFGVYVVAHAHLTPGGGFQGGAILGTAALMVYLIASFEPFRKTTPHALLESADAGGAGLYAAIGFLTLIVGGAFLKNCLPLGQSGKLLSTGTVPLINLGVGLEVAGGFILLFKDFIASLELPEEEDKQEEKEGKPVEKAPDPQENASPENG